MFWIFVAIATSIHDILVKQMSTEYISWYQPQQQDENHTRGYTCDWHYTNPRHFPMRCNSNGLSEQVLHDCPAQHSQSA